MTWTTTSSPSMIFSPGLRVMMSTGAFLLGMPEWNGLRVWA
jgi:hypothetical protein